MPPKGYQPTALAQTCAGKGRNHRPGDATLARVAQRLGRVLVVDDDEVIRRLIAVNLQLEGFDVSMAVDGQDCLDKVGDIDPDVITLDVMMPRLDGWETAVQLRSSPDTAHIKVVLISARAQACPASVARMQRFMRAISSGSLQRRMSAMVRMTTAA